MSSFEEIVKAIPEIQHCFQQGLKALGSDSLKIEPKNSRLCEGSVFLESCVMNQYRNVNLWDYFLSYNGKVYFVEVHPAQTSEVDTVLRKFEWLKQWLLAKAESINDLKADQPYFWIASGRFAILQNSPQYRRVVQKGLKPVPKLKLN
jgi:hypothetical protein